MSNTQELHIGKVSKPVLGAYTTTDITYQYNDAPKGTSFIEWLGTGGAAIDLKACKLAYPLHSSTVRYDNMLWFEEDVTYVECELDISSGQWRVGWWEATGPTEPPIWHTMIDLGSGPYPSSYAGWTVDEIENLAMSADSSYKAAVYQYVYWDPWDPRREFYRYMIVGIVSSLSEHGVAKVPISYKVKLTNPNEPYQTVTVEGTTTSYSAFNSLIGGVVVAYAETNYAAPKLFDRNGDMHGTITMTETPQT